MTLKVNPCDTRPNWRERILQSGLVYNETDNPHANGPDDAVLSYWVEGRYYSITPTDQKILRTATSHGQAMMYAAIEHVIANNLFERFGIRSERAKQAIARSWDEDLSPRMWWPSIVGRFDIRWGGTPEQIAADPSLRYPKFLEYNADTPVSFVESTQTQWDWHQDTPGAGDQWNAAWECVGEAWKRNISMYESRTGRKVTTIHFGWSNGDESGEDWLNAVHYAAAAEAAGFNVKVIQMEEITLRHPTGAADQVVDSDGTTFDIGRFFDADGEHIHILWKLYPWDQILDEAWGHTFLWSMDQPDGTVLVEPPWKMIWNNKAIWPIIWELFKDDPVKSRYLLPAYFEGEQPADFTEYIRKPLHGREGSGMQIFRNGEVIAETGNTHPAAGNEGYILQQFAPLPMYDTLEGSRYVVLGLWVADNDPQGACGLNIRESKGLITDYYAYFVPHRVINP